MRGFLLCKLDPGVRNPTKKIRPWKVHKKYNLENLPRENNLKKYKAE